MVLGASSQGIHTVIVPKENAAEGAAATDIAVFCAESIGEILEHLKGKRKLPLCREIPLAPPPFIPPVDMADVKGQHAAKRALTVALFCLAVRI